MGRSKIKVGVDIGNTKTSIAVGKTDRQGNLVVLGVETTATMGLKKGRVDNIDNIRTLLQSTIFALEDNIEQNVHEVYLAISGGIVTSVNHTEEKYFADKRTEVTEADSHEIAQKAFQHTHSDRLTCLHQTTRYYKLDDRKCLVAPIGKLGHKLEVHVHLIYADKLAVETLRQLFEGLGIRVVDLVYAPVADTLLLLSDEQKMEGTLLLDMGGYYTDYVLFCDGAIEQTGSVPIGGAAISEDIQAVLKLPLKKAEEIKLDYAIASESYPLESRELQVNFEDIYLQSQAMVIDHQLLNEVAYYRAIDIFEEVKKEIPDELLSKLAGGIQLTGGCSQLPEIAQVATEVFAMEVYQAGGTEYGETKDLSTIDHPTYECPENSTVLGLLQYAAFVDELEVLEKGNSLTGWISKLFPKKA